jgi:competence protein CoiA
MIWALKNNERIKAIPKEKANCPLCNEEVIAKCGEIKIWHCSHKSNKDCDDWYEPETEWHINWKNEFPKEQQEIIIGKHRADIKTRTGNIIELQSSMLSYDKIKEREKFYGEKLIWLLNSKTIAKNCQFWKWKGKYYFIWKWKPSICRNWLHNKIFIDFGENIFKINCIKEFPTPKRWNDGYGSLYSKNQFLKIYGDIFKEKKENENTKTID